METAATSTWLNWAEFAVNSGIAISIISYIWRYLKGWIDEKRRNDRENSARTRLLGMVADGAEAFVGHTYDTLVRQWKEAAPDGKLTDEQRAAAREFTWQSMVNWGKTQGVDFAAKIGKEVACVFFERAINQRRIEARAANGDDDEEEAAEEKSVPFSAIVNAVQAAGESLNSGLKEAFPQAAADMAVKQLPTPTVEPLPAPLMPPPLVIPASQLVPPPTRL